MVCCMVTFNGSLPSTNQIRLMNYIFDDIIITLAAYLMKESFLHCSFVKRLAPYSTCSSEALLYLQILREITVGLFKLIEAIKLSNFWNIFSTFAKFRFWQLDIN